MENYGAGEVAPCEGITRADWRLRRQQTKRSTLSGNTDVVELGSPYWEIDIEVALPSRALFDLWSGFIDRRRGGEQTFLMSRTFRPGAREISGTSYPSAAVANYSAPSSQLQISGVTGWAPNIGDMVSYSTIGNGVWIGQIVKAEAGTASPIVLQVEPKTVEPAATSAVRVVDALGEFALDGEPRFREGHRRRSLRFSAKQVIR